MKVMGISKFTASSGRTVRVGEDGTIMFDHANGYLSPQSAMDAEEFYQAKRDEELGRWRWPANPDYVVYPRTDHVQVVNEASGNSRTTTRDRADDSTGLTRAAKAYFDAHPEGKPLPTENGVYVPATARPTAGPLTFVLYNGAWRCTPYSADPEQLARRWHTDEGLIRLVAEVVS